MAKLFWKPGTLLYPAPPALVTCGTAQTPNVFTVAWTGIACSDPPITYISVRPSRYSYELIRQSGEFVINLTHPALARAADFCGVRSGRTVDKIAHLQLAVEPAHLVAPPLLAQSPISLECRVRQVVPLGSHDMFLADIVSVDVRADLVDETGLHLERCGLLAYVHGGYYTLGKQLGSFGYSVRKKAAQKKK